MPQRATHRALGSIPARLQGEREKMKIGSALLRPALGDYLAQHFNQGRTTMRILNIAVVLLMSSVLAPSFAEEEKSPSQPQATPVQPERSTQQSEQSGQQTTTGTSSGRPGKAGGVSAGEQEKKAITSPATSEPDAKGTRER
jgi:hypothetical protein